MDKNLLMKLQKKGAVKLGSNIGKFIGAVVLIFLVVALLPELFTAIAAMSGVESDVPSYVVTILSVIVGIGLIYMVWRVIE